MRFAVSSLLGWVRQWSGKGYGKDVAVSEKSLTGAA
jgi:hypothetical protein